MPAESKSDEIAKRSTDSVRRKCAIWLVPAIMIFIALLHQFRARSYDQSSWIGCGFGMFATLDNHTTRILRAYSLTDGSRTPIPISGDLDALENAVRVVPTQRNLKRLADGLAETITSTSASQLQVEMFHISFDPDSNELKANLSKTVTVNTNAPDA